MTEIHCPCCNASFPAPPGVQVGVRLCCERCGESFVVRQLRQTSAAPSAAFVRPDGISPTPSSPTTLTQEARASLSAPRRWSNRAIAGVVLLVMGGMAATGLTFALLTVDQRRANDRGITGKNTRRPPLVVDPETRPPIAVIPPLQLEGLRYLPADTSILAGVRVTEVLDSGPGREALTRPLQIGPLSLPIQSMQSWTGLRPEQIDHVLFAIRGGKSRWMPQFLLVVRTREPLDFNAVRKQLVNVERWPGSKKEIYRFRLDNGRPPFTEGLLSHPDDRTLLLDWQQEDLRTLEANPFPKASHLSAALREVMETRMKPAGPIWLAGHAENWKEALPALQFLKLDKPEHQLIAALRTFAVWIQLEGKPTWFAALRGADARATKEFRVYLTDRLGLDQSGERGRIDIDQESPQWLMLQYRPR